MLMSKYGILNYNLYIFNVFFGRNVSGINIECKEFKNCPRLVDSGNLQKAAAKGQRLQSWL